MKKIIITLTLLSFGLFAKVTPLKMKNKIKIDGVEIQKLEDIKKINESSQIETNARSFFVFSITVPGGTSTFRLGPKSKVQIKDFSKNVTLDIKRGSIFSKFDKNKKAKIPSKLFIKTKTAAMGVRGTYFFTAYGKNDDVWMCVREGAVEVEASGEKTVVKEGEGIFITKSKLTKPKFYEWTNKINWNNDSEKLESGISVDSIYEDLTNIDYD